MEDAEMIRIASRVIDGGRGHFLTLFAKAYVRADLENRRILNEAWTKVIIKYKLDEKYKKT